MSVSEYNENLSVILEHIADAELDFTVDVLLDQSAPDQRAIIAAWNVAGVVQPTQTEIEAININVARATKNRRNKSTRVKNLALEVMTTLEIDAEDTEVGAMVFNSDTNQVQVWTGVEWMILGTI